MGFAAVTEIDAHLAASLSRRFRLIRQLGAGGMGAVFLAEQVAVGNRPVALKAGSAELGVVCLTLRSFEWKPQRVY